MRIHFDSQIFSAQAYGGISRYVASLACALDALPGITPRILAPFHINAHLQTAPAHLVVGHSSAVRPRALGRLLSLVGSACLQAVRPADILHKTYYYPVPRLPSRARTVLTVHDMIHEKFPESFAPHDPIARWKRQAVGRADVVLCVSENTRKDLLAHYPHLAAERVFVTHLGFDGWPDASPPAADSLPDWPYLLFVGGRYGYKNFSGLLAAYQASTWLQEQVGLLCFGAGAFSATELAQIARLRHPARVRHMSGPDALLARCYRHATVFVYPSLYEGFGLPPLEAMAMDCPVACSHTSAIPEVVGDAGAYFDPHDPEAIRHTLEHLVATPQARDALVQRARAQRDRFSWQHCAQQTLAAYEATLAA